MTIKTEDLLVSGGYFDKHCIREERSAQLGEVIMSFDARSFLVVLSFLFLDQLIGSTILLNALLFCVDGVLTVSHLHDSFRTICGVRMAMLVKNVPS